MVSGRSIEQAGEVLGMLVVRPRRRSGRGRRDCLLLAEHREHPDLSGSGGRKHSVLRLSSLPPIDGKRCYKRHPPAQAATPTTHLQHVYYHHCCTIKALMRLDPPRRRLISPPHVNLSDCHGVMGH